MKELLRSNDPVLLSWVQALLAEADIDCLVFDVHASIVEGSISAIPRRIMVAKADHRRAREIIGRAGSGVLHGPEDAGA